MKRQKWKTHILLFSVTVFALLALFWLWLGAHTFEYSNLQDDESKQQVQALLLEQDVPQENVDALFQLIDAFYSAPYHGIVESGWEKAVIPFFSYDNQDGFAHLDELPDNLINCRTTAFVVMKDHFVFQDTKTTPDEKDNHREYHLFDAEDSLHYDLLYSNIEMEDVASSDRLAEAVTQYWNSAGILFPTGDMQLVTAYGSMGGMIQNFHTAVAIYADECVWLLEKYDPINPYQISRFSDKEQMLDYMKKRISDAEYAAIFSNDSCLYIK